MISRKIFLVAIATMILNIQKCFAQDFDKHFTNNTLRIDYIFSGNIDEQRISVDKMNISPGWYGKKKRLAEVPMEGNGQIIVKTKDTKETIYRNSFSTLFQEWLSYDESKTMTKAFENVFLVPMPKDTVEITVELYNNRRKVTAKTTHTVYPNDILIRRIGAHDVTPHVTVHKAEDQSNCIDIAFVAEGYTEEEMDIYMNDVNIAVEAIFAHEPFKSMSKHFNIVAVKSPSRESGTSTPSKGIWKDTALHSHFDTFYSNRYLTTLNLKELHDWLAGIPYEHIIILANTDEYGGGGILNSYTLSMTHHPLYKPVVVHEFGHSFGGLGDEYAYETEDIPMYPHDVEPWEPNITTLTDFDSKWKDMIAPSTTIPTPASSDENTIRTQIGLFEGAGYSMKGIYRGAQDCRMRTNQNPDFCPVCVRAMTRLIDFYVK